MHKILVVDDEKKSRDFISDLIESMMPDAEITKLKSPLAALELIEQDSFDMIFTDIRMPRMSGLEMIQEIKTRGIDPFIVIISAYDRFEYAQKAMESGASGYLLKPFSRERVEEVLAIYREKREPTPNDVLFLNKSTGTFPVKISDIVAIEKTNKVLLTIHGATFAKTQTRCSLTGIAQQLPAAFIYVNRQCIINSHLIQSFNPKTREVCLSTFSGEISYICSRENVKQITLIFKNH